MRKHSVSIRGHRTSFSIEDDFYFELHAIAEAEQLAFSRLVTRIDAGRRPGENLSSALRLYVLKKLQAGRG